jgi:hypothetical protein
MLRNDLGLIASKKYTSRLAPRDHNLPVLINGYSAKYKSRLPMSVWHGQDRSATLNVEPFKRPTPDDLAHAVIQDINLIGLLTNEELFNGTSYARTQAPAHVKSWLEQNNAGTESTAAQYAEAIHRFVSFSKDHPDFIDKKEVMSIIGSKHVIPGWSRGYFKMENGSVVQLKS